MKFKNIGSIELILTDEQYMRAKHISGVGVHLFFANFLMRDNICWDVIQIANNSWKLKFKTEEGMTRFIMKCL